MEYKTADSPSLCLPKKREIPSTIKTKPLIDTTNMQYLRLLLLFGLVVFCDGFQDIRRLVVLWPLYTSAQSLENYLRDTVDIEILSDIV